MIRKFDLNEYLANPDLHVITRCGMPVRIVCTDVKSYKQPIFMLIHYNIRIAETADVLKEYKANPDFVECKIFEI